MSELRFDGRVAIVTGAGGGLGRAHALLLGSRGCKVVVNDLGGSMHGGGSDQRAAEKVVAEIKALGGEAVPNFDSVENGDRIVETALKAFGKVDVVVNNAGILRDVSFQKMTDEDWDLVYRVHVLGSYKVTKAAWNLMRDQGYGRIVMTASAAGIYGNFGQANYAMAKLGLVGFAQTLALEGKKKNVLVNTVAPIAGSRLTETVLPKELLDALAPEVVSPLVAWLCHESCDETGGLFEVGGGFFAKLHWERSQGKIFANGRKVSPEDVKASWKAITGFEAATHPETIAESMQPILDNVQKKSLGGNEFIDLDQALGHEFAPISASYDQRDLALYALSVGAAHANPTDERELAFVYEMSPKGFQGLPTFAATNAVKAIIDAMVAGQQAPGLNYGFERILHGEHTTRLLRPLPPEAKLTHRAKVKNIWDKGKNAVVVIEIKTSDASGDVLFENELSMFVRGAGGWGGERGPSSDVPIPERAADKVIEEKTEPQQALVFRLNGDRNPLHADPGFAKTFGFDRPILHGLCTFGYAARHAILAFADGDARLFKSIRARFAESVFPGETIVTEMWKEGDKIVLRSKVKERDKVVLSNTEIELYKEVPVAKPKAAPAAAPPSAASSTAVTSAVVFEGIRYFVEKNPDLQKQVNTTFQFKLTNPASAYFIDLKTAGGSVGAGELSTPDVTLELSDENFIGMAGGKLNPQKLYFAGDLKISGNVMASQKLEFLKKIDGEKIRAEMAAAGRLPLAPAGTTTAPTGAPDKLSTGDVVVAIRDYVEKNPDLASQVKTSFQFSIKNPDTSFFVDLKEGKGKVELGTLASADCTLELSDEDFLAMTSGAADPQKLYFSGKLKIGGNVMASQKLMFLKKVDPKGAAEAIQKARASGGSATPAAAPAQAAVVARAPEILRALADRLKKEPSLVKELPGQLGVVAGSTSFVIDPGAGSPVQEGDARSATAVVTLADADLVELARAGDVRDLYQRGKIRVDGDIRLVHRLAILKGLLA